MNDCVTDELGSVNSKMLRTACDGAAHHMYEVVAQHGGSASLNNAQGQTTKKLLAYTTYTTQPKITKKRIKLRKSKKAPFLTNLLHPPFFQIFCHIQIFYFLFFIFSRMWNFFNFYTHLEHKLIKRRAPVFLHGKLGASRVMNK